MATVPEKTTVLVVGGGPGGSYAASVLARRGIDVTVLEAVKFPRYHIGESLLASTNYFLEYIGAREKVLSNGFVRKPGGAFKLRKDFPAAYTNFVDHNTGNHALNVNRSKYDDLLFHHAGSQGAKIFDQHKITVLKFSEKDPKRPVAAEWESKANGTKGTITFDYVIDASGRQGLISTKYNKDRKMTQSLKNIAVWSYWKGCHWFGEGTERKGAPMIEALHDNSGWGWYIPINDETFSIGFVMHEEFVKSKKAGKTLEEFYLSQFKFVTDFNELKEGGTMVPYGLEEASTVHMASDYSYCADDVGKLNYRLVGDAAAFIDPFFSSGVHMAFVGAMSAALSIISIIDGKVDEDAAAEFHNVEVKTAYTRFFVIVLAGYKQMRGGINANILNDVDEVNFDRAFNIIRPVIQGTGDIGVDKTSTGNQKLSEEELQKSMDFVFQIFHPPKAAAHGDAHGNGNGHTGGDIDKDAQERLAILKEQIPYMMGHDGVQHLIDDAKEKVRLSLAGVTLKPVAVEA